ncbi:MAG: hypothetical protein U1E36_00110 [Rickettsiales bacterium]
MNVHVQLPCNDRTSDKEGLEQLFQRIDASAEKVIAFLGASYPETSKPKRGYVKDDLELIMLGINNRPFSTGLDKKKIDQNTHARLLRDGQGEIVDTLQIVKDGISLFMRLPADDGHIKNDDAVMFEKGVQLLVRSTFNEIALYRALATTAERALHDHCIFPDHPERDAVTSLRDNINELYTAVMVKMRAIVGDEAFDQHATDWENYLHNAENIYADVFDWHKQRPHGYSRTRVTDAVAEKMSKSSATIER